MSPLTTEGVIEEVRRFRQDKLALVALVGSLGDGSAADALLRLRQVRKITSEQLSEIRRIPKSKRTKMQLRQQPILEGVHDLANEIEPWLAQVVGVRKE